MLMDIGKNSDCFTAGIRRAPAARIVPEDAVEPLARRRVREIEPHARRRERRQPALGRVRAGDLADALIDVVQRLRGHDRGVGREVRLLSRSDEARAHVGRDEVERAHRRQAEHQLDRLHHARLRVEGAVDRAAPRVRAGHQRDGAMAVDVIDAVLRVVLDRRGSPSSSRTTSARARRRSGRARDRCRRRRPSACTSPATCRRCDRSAGSPSRGSASTASPPTRGGARGCRRP